MSARSEQLVLDYLSRAADAAHGTLRSDERMRFVARLRVSIEQQRRAKGAVEPAEVRRVLATFGDPKDLVACERRSLDVAKAVDGDADGTGTPEPATRRAAEGAAAYGAAVGGAAENGRAEPGTAEQGGTEQSVAEQSVAEHGVAEHGAAEHGVAEHGAAKWGAAEWGAAESGSPKSGPAESGSAKSGPAERGATEQATAGLGAVRQAAAAAAGAATVGAGGNGRAEPGPATRGAATHGGVRQAVAEWGAATVGAGGNGRAEPGPAERGAAERGTATHGAVTQGTAESGAATMGAGGNGRAEPGPAERGAAERGTATHGAVTQGTAESGTATMGAGGNGRAEPGPAERGTAERDTARRDTARRPESLSRSPHMVPPDDMGRRAAAPAVSPTGRAADSVSDRGASRGTGRQVWVSAANRAPVLRQPLIARGHQRTGTRRGATGSGTGPSAAQPHSPGQPGPARGRQGPVPVGGPPVRAVPQVAFDPLSVVGRFPREMLSLVLLGLGGLLLPFPLWLIGAVIGLTSRVWNTRDKFIGIAGALIITVAGVGVIGALDKNPSIPVDLHAYVAAAHADASLLMRFGAALGALYLGARLPRGDRPSPSRRSAYRRRDLPGGR